MKNKKKKIAVVFEDLDKNKGKKGLTKINYFNKRHVSHALTDRIPKGETYQSPK